MKGISVCCLTNSCEQLLIGTEIGNIYILDLNTFKLLDQIIYQDVVMQKSVVHSLTLYSHFPILIVFNYNMNIHFLKDSCWVLNYKYQGYSVFTSQFLDI